MKKKIIFSFLILTALAVFICFNVKEKTETRSSNLQDRIEGIRSFASENSYNDKIAFFINYSISSNKNRFFVIDLKTGKTLEKGLVSHGSGSEKGKVNEKLKFSNVDSSYCTSLGKYLIKNSYNGDFGKAYRLIGLDKTNSNAYSRAIVLHKYSTVPDKETTSPIVLSLGCPMVSPAFFSVLEKYIDNSQKDIVLYMYTGYE